MDKKELVWKALSEGIITSEGRKIYPECLMYSRYDDALYEVRNKEEYDPTCGLYEDIDYEYYTVMPFFIEDYKDTWTLEEDNNE